MMALIQLQVIMMDPGWIPLTANIRGICRTLTVKSTKGDYDCPVTAFRGEVVQLGLQVKVQWAPGFVPRRFLIRGTIHRVKF